MVDNHEIADVIVLELVNEVKFDRYINSKNRIVKYFNEEITFNTFAIRLRQPQGIHYRKDDHTYYLRDQSTEVQHLVALGIITHYWEQHHEFAFTRWDIPAEARYLYEKEVTKTVDFSELEILVLTKYISDYNKAEVKVV